MWCGTQRVTTVLIAAIAVATLATSAHAPIPQAQTRVHALHAASCKPLPPLLVDAVALPGSSERWTLTLRSIDRDRDVRVWMHTTPEDRRPVWQGTLKADEERQVVVTYVASAAAQKVFVELEPSDMGRAIVRGMAVVDIPGRAHVAVSKGQLLENPDTGVKVRQFTGAVGGSR